MILSRTGFRDTGIVELEPDSPFVFAALPTGWSLIFANDVRYAAPEGLAGLSASATVLGVQVEEHAMVSGAALYQDGTFVWSVLHDPDEGKLHLDSHGQLPEQFDAIRARYLASQMAERPSPMPVDYVFDIPVVLAESYTGYRHDRGPAWGRQTYTRLETRPPPRLPRPIRFFR